MLRKHCFFHFFCKKNRNKKYETPELDVYYARYPSRQVSVEDMINLVQVCSGDLPRSPTEQRRRRKTRRGGDPGSGSIFSLLRLIAPGTKWCGVNDIAEDFFDLGEREEVDRCCRAHDHCPLKVRGKNGNDFLNFCSVCSCYFPTSPDYH